MSTVSIPAGSNKLTRSTVSDRHPAQGEVVICECDQQPRPDYGEWLVKCWICGKLFHEHQDCVVSSYTSEDLEEGYTCDDCDKAMQQSSAEAEEEIKEFQAKDGEEEITAALQKARLDLADCFPLVKRKARRTELIEGATKIAGACAGQLSRHLPAMTAAHRRDFFTCASGALDLLSEALVRWTLREGTPKLPMLNLAELEDHYASPDDLPETDGKMTEAQEHREEVLQRVLRQLRGSHGQPHQSRLKIAGRLLKLTLQDSIILKLKDQEKGNEKLAEIKGPVSDMWRQAMFGYGFWALLAMVKVLSEAAGGFPVGLFGGEERSYFPKEAFEPFPEEVFGALSGDT